MSEETSPLINLLVAHVDEHVGTDIHTVLQNEIAYLLPGLGCQ